MKVTSPAPPSGTEETPKKVNKKPQLALDTAFKKLRSGLQVYVEKPGDGEPIAAGHKIKAHFEGWLASDFTLFDSSRKKHRPFEFTAGEGQVIKGWEEALQGMRQGTKLQIKIPAALAYGQKGLPALKIPPNADLLFKVEIVQVKPGVPTPSEKKPLGPEQ